MTNRMAKFNLQKFQINFFKKYALIFKVVCDSCSELLCNNLNLFLSVLSGVFFLFEMEFVNKYALPIRPLSIIYQIKGYEVHNNKVKIIIYRLASFRNISIHNYSCLLPFHKGSLHIYKNVLIMLSI